MHNKTAVGYTYIGGRGCKYKDIFITGHEA